MKKLISVLLSLAVVIGIFSACGKQQTDVPVSENEGGNEAQYADHSKYKLVTTRLGYNNNFYAGTANGAYEVVFGGSETLTAAVIYSDYATQKTVYLSNQLNATMDEQNPGWFGDASGGMYLAASDKHLFAIRNGTRGFSAEDGINGVCPAIYCMTLTGADRQNIEFPNDISLSPGAMVSDGDNLYFIVADIDTDTGEASGHKVVKTDFSGKKLDVIGELSECYYAFTIGLSGNELVIQKRYRDGQDALEQKISLFNLDTGEEKQELFEYQFGQMTIMSYGSKIYYVNNSLTDTNLYSFDLISKETEVIADIAEYCEGVGEMSSEVSAQAEMLGDELSALSLNLEPHDDHLIVTAITAAEDRWFAVNLNNNEVKELTLRGKDISGGESPVVIINAESPDYYLVTKDIYYVWETSIGQGGEVSGAPSEWSELSLIKKEDYWNNVPSYLVIEDTVRDVMDKDEAIKILEQQQEGRGDYQH